jgi:hypothetical protein
MRSIVLVLVCVLGGALRATAQTVTIDLEGLVLSLSTSRTAQVFHIVDQLSEWDQFTHKQYGRWARKSEILDQTARDLLKRHTELRKVFGWNSALERAFYVDESIEAAARRAVQSGALTAEQAETEVAVLRHFERVLTPLLDQGGSGVAAFTERLKAEAVSLRPLIQQLRRFADAQTAAAVSVYLVPNPEERSGGGGASGNRIVLEVQKDPDPLPILIHEALHALLDRHRPAVSAAAESVGLTWQRLNEGIAYALAPGLTGSDATRDALAEAWAQRTMGGAGASDSFIQFYTVATVIRPLLRDALERGETITTFLPKAAEKWRTLRRP